MSAVLVALLVAQAAGWLVLVLGLLWWLMAATRDTAGGDQ